MVKAAGKKQSNVDIQRIQQIARESRSETLARLQASAEGLSKNKAEVNRKNMAKIGLGLTPMLLIGDCCGNQSLLRSRLL